MRAAAHSRFAPLLVFVAGTALAAVIVFASERREYDGYNYYDARSAMAALIYAAAASSATGWSAVRARGCAGVFAGGISAIWAIVAAALLFDVAWAVVGPGVDRMRDRCIGGMDCIGEILPGAPLTGDGAIVEVLALLSAPLMLILVLACAFPGRASTEREHVAK